MGGAEHDASAFILPDHLARVAQLGKKLFRQAQSGNDLFVKFQSIGIRHASSGSVSEFLSLCPTEPVHQVFGNHQKVCDAFQSPLTFVGIELIQRIKGLKLASRMAVQSRKRHLLMDFRNYIFCSVIPIGNDRKHLLVAFQQHIVHSPSVDGKASYFVEFFFATRMPYFTS